MTQWSHPMEAFYQSVVYMLREGDALMEAKALAHPPRPEETIEMAKYFGIDVKKEPYLVTIAKVRRGSLLPLLGRPSCACGWALGGGHAGAGPRPLDPSRHCPTAFSSHRRP